MNNQNQIKHYLSYLRSQGASAATLKRKTASLRKFTEWRKKEYPKERVLQHTRPLQRYFAFLIGLVLLTGLGWGIYTQFIAKPPETPSLATLPTLPPNLISFQGRLTNAVKTPITATVSASFKLYNVDTDGSNLWSETKDVEPDDDGIFNTMLGSSNPIDASIFADNPNLWLGITIDVDDEMEPRQQIATVGYAYNTKYLQGYPASSSATANTIPVVNASGDLVLASASPSLESTSGTFGIKGQAILLQSNGGAGGGDITIEPDADDEGQVIIISNTTSDDSFIVKNANITSGDLIAAEAGVGGGGYNLINLSSGSPLTSKFFVDAGGTGYFAGSVGIGTTNPIQPLHVEGQCVTGDTLLPIVPPSKEPSSITSEEEPHSTSLRVTSEEGLAYVQIKDIKGEERVLSLDESTGKIVPAKIKGLLDMGVKPVYRLTTEDGRTIKTTGNHPYLIVKQTLLEENNVSQEKSNNSQTKSNSCLGINIENINFAFCSIHNDFLKINAIPDEIIANSISIVKINNFLLPFSSEKLGTTSMAPNQPADKLIDKSEAIIDQTGSNLITNNLTDKNDRVKQAQWTKVICLSPGDEIAVTDSSEVKFVKIASIEYVGKEQVYDIEVEGTHNFVAGHFIKRDSSEVTLDGSSDGGERVFGGIIAHNTYISGNVGIGTTGLGYKLDVDGTGRFTGAVDFDGDIELNSTLTDINDSVGTNGQLLSSTSTGVDWIDSSGLGTDDQTLAEVLGEGYVTSAHNIVMSTTDEIRFYDDDDDARIYGPVDGQVQIDSTVWGVTGAGVASGFTQLTVDNVDINGNTIAATNASGLFLYDDGGNGIFVKDGGNVGIGTTNPSSKLYINGNIKADKFIDAEGGGDYYLDPAGATSLIVAGNVGIGTTGPSAKLEIGGSTSTISNSSGDITINANSNNISLAGDSLINFGQMQANLGSASVPPYSFNGDTNTGFFSPSADTLGIGTSGVERFRIAVDGNVGIGNTAPAEKLDVAGNVRADGFIEYSTEFTGNALDILKNVKTKGSGNEEWKAVSHTSLPSELIKEYIEEGSCNDPNLPESAECVDLGNNQRKVYGRSLNSMVSINRRSLQQLGEITDWANTEVNAPDYVFEENYSLTNLADLEEYTQIYKHLPGLPDANDAASWAKLSLQDRDMKLLEKVEENILYTIDQEKKIQNLENLVINKKGKLILNWSEENQDYQVKRENKVLNNIGGFAKIISGQIESGLTKTTQLIAEKITTKKLAADKIISPLAEFEELKANKIETEEISSGGGDLTIDLGSENNPGNATPEESVPATSGESQDKFGKLLVKGDANFSGSVDIDQKISASTATFGQLLAENVGIGKLEAEKIETQKLNVAQDATFSGTLYADKIIAREGGFGELLSKSVSLDNIKSIVREELKVANEEENDESSVQDNNAEFEELEIDKLLAEVEKWLDTSTENDLELGCSYTSQEGDSAPTSEVNKPQDNFCLIDEDFTVLGGHTSLSDTSITGQLSVGSLIISGNSIDTLGDTLYIQQLAMGGLDILAGKITVDINGNVFINQDLEVGGNLIASNIKPQEGESLTIDLGQSAQDTTGSAREPQESEFGKLLIKGIGGETVASIDASGSAKFKEIATDSLRINTDADEATESGVIIAAADNFENVGIFAPGIETNATAGEATLPAYETEIIIYNEKLTDQSLVYLTPTSDTKNKILYVKIKKGNKGEENDMGDTGDRGDIGEEKGYFVVGINGAPTAPVKFNWWIIN